MNFIRKIAEKKRDEWVHIQFTRYGPGTYDNKALVKIKQGKSSLTIKTGFEFAGELAYGLAATIPVGKKVRVKGGIITTKNLDKETGLPIAGKKQFAGVKTFLLDSDMGCEEIQALYKTMLGTLVFLSFTTSAGSIVTKVKNPKSSKSSADKEDEELKIDFCTFKTKDIEIVKDFAFDFPSKFLEAVITHTFIIDKVDVPKEMTNDFAKARLMALRKGKLIRQITVDGKQIHKEYPLEG